MRRKVTGCCEVSSQPYGNFLLIPLGSFFAGGCNESSQPIHLDGIVIGLPLRVLFSGTDEQPFGAKSLERFSNLLPRVAGAHGERALAAEELTAAARIGEDDGEDKQLATLQPKSTAHHPVLYSESGHTTCASSDILRQGALPCPHQRLSSFLCGRQSRP